jgi:hypothetical protein
VIGVVRNPDRVPELRERGVELRRADLAERAARAAFTAPALELRSAIADFFTTMRWPALATAARLRKSRRLTPRRVIWRRVVVGIEVLLPVRTLDEGKTAASSAANVPQAPSQVKGSSLTGAVR